MSDIVDVEAQPVREPASAPAVVRNENDRTVMHVLYGLHTVAWASAGMLAVIALIVNYIKRGEEIDPLYNAFRIQKELLCLLDCIGTIGPQQCRRGGWDTKEITKSLIGMGNAARLIFHQNFLARP